MKSITLYTIAALATTIAAFPSIPAEKRDDPRFYTWSPPGPGDVRSPCPGLNTLANHGFIHHDGKNMTIPHLIAGLKAGLNVGADFSTAIGEVGFFDNPAGPLAQFFNLDQLDKHNYLIEHDGSLSRRDAYFGNDHSFYFPNWNQVLQVYGNKAITDIPTAAKAKYTRVSNSRAIDPNFTYGPQQFILSYGETALYLQTMGDPYSGKSRLDFIRMLFEQERLPYELGWRPSASEINLNTLGAMVLQLYLASPEPAMEGLLVTADTYKVRIISFSLLYLRYPVLKNIT